MSIRCGSLLLLALLVLPPSLSTSACADDDGVETMIGATDARAPFVNRLTSISPPRVKAVVLPNATCPQLPLVAPFGCSSAPAARMSS
jgi:hypothetical protein